MVGEQRPHLLRGFDVVAGTVEPEPVRIIFVSAHTDTQQRVVGVGLILSDVVGVVGDQQRNV